MGFLRAVVLVRDRVSGSARREAAVRRYGAEARERFAMGRRLFRRRRRDVHVGLLVLKVGKVAVG
jgi:hypothetical protein